MASAWARRSCSSSRADILWVAFRRHPAAAKSFLGDARLGFPTQLAVPAIGPVISVMCRLNNATDTTARADLPRIPAALDHVDQLSADSTIPSELPNAADFQLGASSDADVLR